MVNVLSNGRNHALLVEFPWSDTMRITFGDRIKALRILKGFTQPKVADACEVTVPTVARWEADTLSPSIEH